MSSALVNSDNRSYLSVRSSVCRHRQLRVVICGGGLAGLSAAIALRRKNHAVVVLEATARLCEVGAGIQLPPNCTRILYKFGLEEKLRDHVVLPRNISLKRYATGQQLGSTPLHPYLSERHGFPYCLIHRADYQRLLFETAISLGAQVIFSARVAGMDQNKPSVTTVDGREFECDIIVGADGVRSKTRDCIFSDIFIQPKHTANCAFRATVPVEEMMMEADTAELMTDGNSNAWIGPDRHIMAYPIRRGALYNLVMCHPGQAKPGEWNMPGNVNEIREIYADFDPVIRKVIQKVKKCLKWTLAEIPPLKSWLSESGKVVLIGDAAHAMVPFLAQGASISIEDGACLAECLGAVQDPLQIPQLLELFEKLRKPHAERVQMGSVTNGRMWHLQDGPEQKSRDYALQDPKHDKESLKKAVEDAEIPNPWSDQDFQPWLFGFDVIKTTQDAVSQMEYELELNQRSTRST